MLLYKDGSLMQVLEGEESVLRKLHATISKVPRHRDVATLMQGSEPGRQFPSWSMGFRDLGADLDSPEGYSEFLNFALTGNEFKSDHSKAQRLLLSFKKSG